MTLDQWTATVLEAHKYKHNPSHSEVEHILDFLKMNPNFRLSSRVAYPTVKTAADTWTVKLNKRTQNSKESGSVEEILNFPKINARLVRLKDQTALNWEGKHMGHCVASYRNHEGIYSIRDEDQMPHVTIEISSKYIKQIKGKANGQVPPKYVPFVLETLNHFNLKVNKWDLSNMGYKEISSDLKNFYEEYISGFKIVNFDGQSFIYTDTKVNLKKRFKECTDDLFRSFAVDNFCLEAIKNLVQNGMLKDPEKYFYFNPSLNSEAIKVAFYLLENKIKIDDYTLQKAIEQGNLVVINKIMEVFPKIIDHNCSVINLNRYPANNHEKINLALDQVKQYLPHDYFAINQKLFDAVKNKDSLLEIENLVKQGAKVSAINSFGNTLLQEALDSEHKPAFEFLINQGAYVYDTILQQILNKDLSADYVNLVIDKVENISLNSLNLNSIHPDLFMEIFRSGKIKMNKYELENLFKCGRNDILRMILEIEPHFFTKHLEIVLENFTSFSISLFRNMVNQNLFNKKTMETMHTILQDKGFTDKEILELLQYKIKYIIKEESSLSDFFDYSKAYRVR